MSQNPFINGELTLLEASRTRAAEAVTAFDTAIAALKKVVGGPAKPAFMPPMTTKELAVAMYLNGKTLDQVGRKFGVSSVTVRQWVIAAGHIPRNQKQAQMLRAKLGR